MTFDISFQRRIFVQYRYHIIQCFERFRKQLGAVNLEENIAGAGVYFLDHLFLHNRTTIVFLYTRNIRAFIFFIVYTVFISVRHRATLVTGNTVHVRTFVLVVVDTVFIAVRYRTSIVFGYAWYGRTFVFAVNDAIAISVFFNNRLRHWRRRRSYQLFLVF